jgi:flagellar M-ring protein FliF
MAAATSPGQDRRSLPIWAIVSAFAAVTAVVVAGYLLFFRTEYAVLSKDLRPAAAAPIVEELKKQRIPYRLANGGADILVPAASLDSVRLDVSQADTSAGGLNGFELFDNSDMGLTDFAQRIKFQRALQGELTRTILLINDVAEARVHLSLPERSLFRGDAALAKASVTLITRSRGPMSAAEVEGVQQLVASAIPELKSDDVVVLNGRGEVVSVPPQAPVSPETVPAEDAVTQALRTSVMTVLAKTLPGTRFQLRIERAAQPALVAFAPIAKAGGEAEAPAVTPKASALPQASLEIIADRPLTAEEQTLVRASIDHAKLTPTAAPVSFAVEAAPQAPREAPALQSATAAAPTPTLPDKTDAAAGAGKLQIPAPSPLGPMSTLIILGLALALVVVIAAGLMLSRRVPVSRPLLAFEDHSRFAERLKAGLAEQDREATPHAV